MRPTQAVLLGIGIIVLAWGSLFITVLNQSHKTNQLLRADQKLLNQDTTILNAERDTQVNLEARIADLQAHVDCLFNLATQSGSHISNASTCTVSNSGKAVPQPSKPITNPSPSPSQSSTPAPSHTTPSSQPSLIQRLLSKVGL